MLIDNIRIHVTSKYEAEDVLEYYESLGFARVDELKSKAYHAAFPYLGKYVNGEITAYKSSIDKEYMEYREWKSLTEDKCDISPVSEHEVNSLLFS